MIAIRVDGNSEIATGHIMRCLSIANGLREYGQDCLFIVADENSEQLLANTDFKVINLHSIWNNLEYELPKITEVIFKYGIDKIIVDTYSVTYKYLDALEEKCSIIYIDDMNFFKYPVSALINYNIYADKFRYSNSYTGTKTKFFFNPDYAPLRSEFKNIIPVFRKKVEKILITAGGVDTYNAAGQILSKVVVDDFFDGVEFHMVVGRLNSHIMELEEAASKYSSVVIHKNVEKMSLLMVDCDVAVTAGGSTMYELCACGVPSVCFSWVDNQMSSVDEFSDRGLMIGAGDIRSDTELCISKIVDGLKRYCVSYSDRVYFGERMRDVVDGEGVKRICEVVIDI